MSVLLNSTVRSVLEFHVRRCPAKTFLVFESAEGVVRDFTYQQFDERVNRTANVLHSLGVGKGDQANVHLPNTPEFLLTWLACAKLGAVMVATDPRSTPEEHGYIVGHSESKVTVRRDASNEIVVESHAEAVGEPRSFDELVEGASAEPPALFPEPMDMLMMQYTSGTTSKPKGVLITHAAFLYGSRCIAEATQLRSEDRHMVVLPLFHMAAQIHAVIPALLVGASMLMTERFSASRFFDQALAYDCTAAALFGAPIRMILNQPYKSEWRDNRLRYATYAQNITGVQWDDWHDRFGVPLQQLWGMTETVGLPLMNPLYGVRKPMSMGIPVPGYSAKVVSEDGHEVPAGIVGEVIARGVPGRTIMSEYFRNPKATAETLRRNECGEIWLHSGDRATVDEDGYFYFVDRAKDIIKRAGENIASSEVEAVIKEHPNVLDATVVGVPDPVRDEAVKAFVILKDGETVEVDEIIAWCGRKLNSFKVPEMVEFRDEFPRTSVGKIQKHLLRQRMD